VTVVAADPVTETPGIVTVEEGADLVRTGTADETVTVGVIRAAGAGLLVMTESAEETATVGDREAENETIGGMTDAAVGHDHVIDAGTGAPAVITRQ